MLKVQRNTNFPSYVGRETKEFIVKKICKTRMDTFTAYNPLSPSGQYNINTKLYNNKRLVLISLFFIGIILSLMFINEYYTPIPLSVTPQYTVPSAIYGNGPFGYGNYLPPQHILIAGLQ